MMEPFAYYGRGLRFSTKTSMILSTVKLDAPSHETYAFLLRYALLTSLAVLSGEAHGTVALVGVVGADTGAAILARSDHLAEVGFHFAIAARESFLTGASVVSQSRTCFRTKAAIVARLSLASAGLTTIFHISRIDDGIDEIQFHSVHLELR